MGFSIKEIFRKALQKGIMLSWSDGKMFDPTDQIRTDAVKDIVKSKSKKGDYNVELDSRSMEQGG